MGVFVHSGQVILSPFFKGLKTLLFGSFIHDSHLHPRSYIFRGGWWGEQLGVALLENSPG